MASILLYVGFVQNLQTLAVETVLERRPSLCAGGAPDFRVPWLR